MSPIGAAVPFVDVVREELGLDRYSDVEAERVTASYMETMKKQVDDYLTEAKQEMTKSGLHIPYGQRRPR